MRFAFLVVAACGGSGALHASGSSQDEGGGELANVSSKMMTSAEGSGSDGFAKRRRRGATGGQTYGGGAYANHTVPAWNSPHGVHRTHHRHTQRIGLTGAIEGQITWRGALPAKRASACGPLEIVRVGANRGVQNVVVTIEHVQEGRTLHGGEAAATVGGTVVKRGCALLPAAQIVTPLPAPLSIHGDAKPAKLRALLPTTARELELQESGRVSLTTPLGVTKIESVDGTIAAAWVIGSDAPYFAITDDHGQFRIDELASGTYEVTIWHAPLPDEGTGPISYGPPIVQRRKVVVDGSPKARASRLDLQIGR